MKNGNSYDFIAFDENAQVNLSERKNLLDLKLSERTVVNNEILI